MTNKLYYTSPKLFSWETTIKKMVEKDGNFLITLEETAFYPEGGGQPSDYGLIDGIQVVDVFEENDEVFHQLAERPKQKIIKCEIDWIRRFDHMQHHTGQHLLSAVCIELYNANTISFHLGNEMVTIDVDISELTKEQLHHIEYRVNQLIYRNLEIKTKVVTKDQLHSIPLRKIPDVTDNIRIVEIDQFDYSACCGTHVGRTGEIGLIKLIKTEKQRGNTRIYFLCGMRAMANYQNSHEIISTLITSFSVKHEDITDRVLKMEQENKLLQKELDALKLENANFFASKLLADTKSAIIQHTFETQSLKEVQIIARAIFQKKDTIVLFLSIPEQKVLLAHSGSFPIHCGQIFKEHLNTYSGRGGGNDKQAQASFESIQQMDEFAVFLSEHLYDFAK